MSSKSSLKEPQDQPTRQPAHARTETSLIARRAGVVTKDAEHDFATPRFGVELDRVSTGPSSGPDRAGSPKRNSSLEGAIEQSRGSGQALDSGMRVWDEPMLGADLQGVKIHTGQDADALNQALGARAFTTGQDIFFRDNEYDPGSSAGQELLAHELTHVVQQGGGPRAKLSVSQPDDPYEQEADEVAKRMMSTQPLRACSVRDGSAGSHVTAAYDSLTFNDRLCPIWQPRSKGRRRPTWGPCVRRQRGGWSASSIKRRPSMVTRPKQRLTMAPAGSSVRPAGGGMSRSLTVRSLSSGFWPDGKQATVINRGMKT